MRRDSKLKNTSMRYSAAYPTGAERCLDQKGCEI